MTRAKNILQDLISFQTLGFYRNIGAFYGKMIYMKNVANIPNFTILALLGIWGPHMAQMWLVELKKSGKSCFFDLRAPNWAPNVIQ